jgi:hypothetical protein
MYCVLHGWIVVVQVTSARANTAIRPALLTRRKLFAQCTEDRPTICCTWPTRICLTSCAIFSIVNTQAFDGLQHSELLSPSVLIQPGNGAATTK